jgi:PAS domain S-box-containing protein
MSTKNYGIKGKAGALLNLLSDPAVIVDGKGNFLIVNGAFEEVTGISRKELIGNPYSKLNTVTTESKAVLSEKLKTRLQNAPVEPYEICFTGETGETRFVELKEKERESQSEVDEISSIIDGIGDILFIMDAERHLIRVNKSACEVFKKKPEELLGKHCYEIVHGTDKPWPNCPAEKMFETRQTVSEEVNDPNMGVPLLVTTSPILDKRGEIIQCIHIAKDISKIKLAEMEMHIAANLFDAASDSIIMHELEGRIVYFNEAAYKTRGYTKDEFQELGVQDLEAPDNPRFFGSRMRELLDKGEATFEAVNLRKDNTVMPVEIHAQVIESDGRKLVLSVARDITERKRIEETLRESKEKLRSIIENSSDQIFMLDRDCRFLLVNKTAADLFGTSPQEMVGRSISEIFPETIAAQFSRNIKNVFDTGKRLLVDEKMVAKGRELYSSTSLNPVRDRRGRVIAVTGIVRDITERKKAEEELKESEEKYRILFELAPDGIMSVSTDGIVISVNPGFLKLVGYVSEEEIVGKPFMELKTMRIEDIPKFQSMFKSLMKEGSSSPVEFPYFRKDGTSRWAEVHPGLLIKDGNPVGLQVIMRDVTERKKAEQAVSASLKRYQSFIEVTGELGWVTNAAGEVAEDTPSFRNFTGQTYDEVKGWGWIKAVHPEDVEHATRAWQAAVAAKTMYEVEYRLRRCDGVYRNFMVRGAPIFEEDGKIREWVGTCIDITERKKAEEALNRTMDELVRVNEKLGVVGSLTRHDVRNKLCAITGNAFLLKKKHADQPDITEGIGKMEQATKEIEKILDFAKIYEQLGVEELTYLNLEEKLNEATSLFSGPLPKIISECQGLTVLADSFLRQLFYNFIDNTRKYGEKTTTIRVHCEKADQDSLELVYEDDGVGVPFESKSRLFKEGFSTGGSTGFGLFLSKKMMDVYGWEIKENGEPGKGAKFTITIPRLNKNGQENFQIAAEYDPKSTIERNTHFVISNSEGIYSHSSNTDVVPVRLKKGGGNDIADQRINR